MNTRSPGGARSGPSFPERDELIRTLKLEPLPGEGGLFVQTYLSEETIPQGSLPRRYSGERRMGTVIYYMLTDGPDSFSALHKLETDEVWHFYLGDPAELLLLYPDGSGRRIVLGTDLLDGEHVQFRVPRGVWQGGRLLRRNAGGGKKAGYALMGTSMAPAFHPDDFTLGNRAELTAAYPDFAPFIADLTRE
jgi:hypothetical protein